MKTLQDIPINDISFLSKLAALAPAEEGKGPTSRMARGKKSRPRGDLPSDLGPVDVESYLNHYNIEFQLKTSGSVRIYRLPYCLFDASHRKNEAAVIQDDSGLLTYQCFHNSCKGRTWHEAKKIISGEDPLAPFCEGYDPTWQPPPGRKTYKAVDEDRPFLLVGDKGQVKFVPAEMADYLERKFKPFFYEGKCFGDSFFGYNSAGVWKELPDPDLRKFVRGELGKHAKPVWIDNSISLLGDQSYLPPDILKPDPLWLNLQNGMLHLETMELRPHSPDFYSRVQLPIEYNEEARCTLWFDTLAEIFEDDLKKPELIQEFFGYCLYPKIIFPAALFQIGQGANGKAVVERVLCALLGKENVSHVPLERLETQWGPIEIKDKLLNSCGETESGPLKVTKFKAIAAGDEIQAEGKYRPVDVKFTPIAKHMVSMNAFPGVKDKTDAFFRRIIVLEYKQKFEGEREDKHRAERLLEELGGIFMWSLAGLKRVLKNETIVAPESVVQAKKRFRARINPVLTFVEEECMVGARTQVLPSDLYRAYRDWCEDAKIQGLGKHNFYEQIFLNFDDVQKKREGSKEILQGIGLGCDPAPSFS